jgi:hypothetical protein
MRILSETSPLRFLTLVGSRDRFSVRRLMTTVKALKLHGLQDYFSR